MIAPGLLLWHTIQLCTHCQHNPAGFWVRRASDKTVRRPWCLACCAELDRGRYQVIPFDGTRPTSPPRRVKHHGRVRAARRQPDKEAWRLVLWFRDVLTGRRPAAPRAVQPASPPAPPPPWPWTRHQGGTL